MPKNCDPAHIAAMSEKVINAFMNAEGGTLYIGIDPSSWTVQGVAARDIDMEAIKEAVIKTVSGFEPKLDDRELRKLQITTVAVIDRHGALVEDRIVIKMVVPTPSPSPCANGQDEKIEFVTAEGLRFKKNLNYIMKVVM